APFETIHGISLLRNSLVKLGLELVTVAQKETRIPEVENAIVKICQGMTEYCDELVLNMKESLVVQPASLEMATIRKKPGDELGMNIQSSYFGCHIIGFIKETSPAHLCSKIEKGDEVLQVNNQTVLGWQLTKLVAALRENPKEVTMLLKKRPRHTTPYGNYPNRRQMGSRHVPSVATLPKTTKKRRSKEGDKPQRPTLEEYVSSSVPGGDIYITKCFKLRESPEDTIDGNDTDNDVFRSGSESPQSTLPVIVDAKQRRATVSGGSPTFERPSLVVEDLDPVPLRPKSQAVISAEKDAAVAAMLAAEQSGQKFLVKEKDKKFVQKVPETSNADKLGSMLQNLGDVLNADSEFTPKEVIVSLSQPTEQTTVVTGVDKVNVQGQTDLTEPVKVNVDHSNEQCSLDGHEVVEVKSQEFTVTKPTPLTKESAAKIRQQKVISTEVAGNEGRSDLPQLVRIKRLDSEQIHQLESKMGDDDVFDKQHKFHHVVVGGVLQTIPAESSQSVKMRPKTSTKTKLNRRVSCKDLGQGECEGWLYKKKQKHGTLSKNWDKRWCVLKNSNLFYYKHKDDDSAEGVIHLPAFFVSPAPYLKTKKFAFKIHNGGTAFHFASERQEDMSKWMNKMGLAAISYSQNCKNVSNTELPTVRVENPSVSSIDSKTSASAAAYYSESEGDDEDGSIHGSCQSLDSMSSPQTSPATKKHPILAEIKNSSIGTSTEELHAMLRSIERQNLTIDGKNKIKQRQSQITASNDLVEVSDPATVEVYRKLHSLQRTLKAKEMELQQLETLFDKAEISELKTFYHAHLTDGQ
ncbi:connector enhancer of kinase suppressor of ras 2, partial [Biomphalaria pfeifferi]